MSAVRAVQPADVLLLDIRRYHQSIRRINDSLLGDGTLFGFALPCPRALLRARKRVESGYVRRLPSTAQFHRDHARQPVMAVNQRILDSLALLKSNYRLGERVCVRVEVIKGSIGGAGFKMDDARVITDWDYLRLGRVMHAREHIHPAAL